MASTSAEPVKVPVKLPQFHLKLPSLMSQDVARKCIVCGTTNHEHSMKPFLLKGEQLNIWTNAYFCHKRHKLYNFYSKLRYTINPFACTDHFRSVPAAFGKGKQTLPPITTKIGARTCQELLSDGEEPPSIQRITEKKSSPEPEEKTDPRTEKEVSDAIMKILEVAKVEIDKEEETRKMLAKITRKMNKNDLFEDTDDEPVAPKEKRVKKTTKKKKRKKEKEKKPVDGNEADSDDATVDVTGIDSEKEDEESSTDDSGGETASAKSVCLDPPPPAVPARRYPTNAPPPATAMVPRFRPRLPISMPKPGEGGKPKMILKIPRRLTLNVPGGPAGKIVWRRQPALTAKYVRAPMSQYQRPSWVAPNPGQSTLASVLQKFWDEDEAAPTPLAPPPSSNPPRLMLLPRQGKQLPRPFGRTILPGTRTKFVPAALKAPSLKDQKDQPSPTRQQFPIPQHPSVRSAALLHNPPLSPSRLIVANEETVETTPTSDTESKTVAMSDLSSSDNEECSDVEVCSTVGARSPIVGQKIEGVLEELEEVKSAGTRSRTDSSVLSCSSEELTIVSSDEEDVEVDVETLDETLEKIKPEVTVVGNSATAPAPAPAAAAAATPAALTEKRKPRLYPSRVFAHRMFLPGIMPRKLIPPPSAVMKPPTKLLSASHLSMKEALHAQARAAAVQPVRIDTTGLMGRTVRIRSINLRPADMPRLESQAEVRKERESEWARLEKVVSKKMAEHRAQIIAEKKKKFKELLEEQMNSDNPPPVLDRAVEAPSKEDAFTSAVIKAHFNGKEARRCKVLRLRFHKKKEEVDFSKLKVVDRSTVPSGVGREEEVDACSLDGSPPALPKEKEEKENLAKKEKNERKQICQERKKVLKQVPRPKLLIVKSELMEMKEVKEQLNAPPPTPVVGIPDKKEFQARRMMYEQKRHDTKVRAGLRYGRLRMAGEEWQRRKLQELNVRGEQVLRALRKKAGEESEDEEEEMEEEALVAESVKIVRMVKAAKMRVKRVVEAEEKKWRRKEAEKDILCISDIELDEKEIDEKSKKDVLCISDIECDEKETEPGKEDDCEAENEKEEVVQLDEDEEDEEAKDKEEKKAENEKEPEGEEEKAGKEEKEKAESGEEAEETDAGAVIDERDEEWRIKGAAKRKMEEEMERDSEEEVATTRRKSHRLQEKRKAMPRKERKLIWRMSDDEEEEDEKEPVQPVVVEPVVTTEKRKRGRPRKNPVGPPPKKKREENKMMTEEVLSRVLPPIPVEGEVEESKEEPPKMDEIMPMEMDDLTVANEGMEGEKEKEGSGAEMAETDDMPVLLEKQDPKPAEDDPTISASKRRRMSWSTKNKLGAHLAAHHNEMGGRLCQYCIKYQKRYLFIPNDPMALMDHARIHCVETLMCPNTNCTYMNTARARISQHVSYVHKKWGMPIDLSEVYPSMRKSLLMRLRQCFPDLPTLSVCQLCRVAVPPGENHHRWHAQTHMNTQAFECSRNICKLKFSSERECFDHIQASNCRGTIVSGMTAEMEQEVKLLVGRCFGAKMIFSRHIPKKDDAPMAASDGDVPSLAPPSPIAQPPILQKEVEEEEEKAGPSR